MTLKLMKYELRSMLRTFIPIWCVILALSLINRFTLRIEGLSELLGGVPAVLLMVAYVLSIIAVFVIGLIFLILRFYHGLLKDEGYLMFTLPVKASQLLNSKLFSAVILMLGTSIVCLLSLCVLVLDRNVVEGIAEAIRMLTLNNADMPFTLETFRTIMWMGVAASVISLFAAPLECYLAMAIGQLANKSKAAWSVLSYFGLSMVMSLVGNVLYAIPVVGKLRELEIVAENVEEIINSLMLQTMTSGLILAVLMLVAFYIPTWLILKNKLNLE